VKSVFQVHGIDAEGNVIIRRQLKRRYLLAFFQKLPPCLVVKSENCWII
jgi:transposase